MSSTILSPEYILAVRIADKLADGEILTTKRFSYAAICGIIENEIHRFQSTEGQHTNDHGESAMADMQQMPPDRSQDTAVFLGEILTELRKQTAHLETLQSAVFRDEKGNGTVTIYNPADGQ